MIQGKSYGPIPFILDFYVTVITSNDFQNDVYYATYSPNLMAILTL